MREEIIFKRICGTEHAFFKMHQFILSASHSKIISSFDVGVSINCEIYIYIILIHEKNNNNKENQNS